MGSWRFSSKIMVKTRATFTRVNVIILSRKSSELSFDSSSKVHNIARSLMQTIDRITIWRHSFSANWFDGTDSDTQ